MSDQPRFDRLWQRVVGLPADGLFQQMDAGYSAAGRVYHNWRHIGAMLAGLDQARAEPEFAANRFDNIELAIWFHDAIYDPLAKDNEAKSAELFRLAAESSANKALIEHVSGMILATMTHAPDNDLDTRLLLDLDLAVLGQPAAAYDDYVARVRREYSAVPDEAWRAGRPAILRRFLERPAIYQTSYFRERLEEVARENIALEIQRLTSG